MAGALKKSSSLAGSVGVTKLIRLIVVQFVELHKYDLNDQPTKAGALKKSSSLAGSVGVTKINRIHCCTLGHTLSYCTSLTRMLN